MPASTHLRFDYFLWLRSLEIAADLNNMAKASDLEQGAELEPSGNAAAYADYVGRLGLLCTEEDDPGRIEDAALR